MIIGNREFDLKKHTYVMGILNATPDSFSDGGEYMNMDAALLHAEKMIRDGADIIDVGGESTRPGYSPVSADEEIERVVPIIGKIKSEFDIPVSVDTSKPEVAKESIAAGADLVNDVWGLQKYEEMGSVIAKAGVPCCLMHNKEKDVYENFKEDLFTEMSYILHKAIGAGISEDKIILDPGIGFAKNQEENIWTLNNMDRLKYMGVPFLVGASRKSVIGNALNLPVEERLEGTLAVTALAVMKGASFVRVHDVLENKRVIDMLEAVLHG